MKLKFNNIRDLADARYAAAMMAEWMGFETGGENDLSAAEIQEILGWCSGPTVVLEVKSGANLDKIQSLLELLPFTAIEAAGDNIENLKSRFGTSIQQWIAVDSASPDADFFHTPRLTSDNNSICRVNPGETTPESLISAQPFAISLDCFESVSTGIKDFEVWNHFFEELGLD